MKGISVGLVLATATIAPVRADAPAFPGPLAPVVGSCWRADSPDGKQVDTHCYRLTNHGHAVEDRHVVSGGSQPYGGTTTYYRDPLSGRIGYTYVASDGGLSRGELEATPDGFTVQRDRYVGSGGNTLSLRSRMTLIDSDRYRMTTVQVISRKPKPMFDQIFARVGPAPAIGSVKAGDLMISRAIILAVQPVGVEVAAYLAIDNSGPEDRLLGISCTCADTVELHAMVGEGAGRRMEKRWPLVLSAGTRTEVKPGSPMHLMLVSSRHPITLGQPVSMTLRFERAGAIEVEFWPVSDSKAGW